MFASIEQMIRTSIEVEMLYEDNLPIGLLTVSEEAMELVAEAVRREVAAHPDFSFQRNSVYMRFCHREYHKGSALGELCRLENIPSHHVLAAGDHFNDLSMLDGCYAQMTACPANAIEPVKSAVRKSGGYVAEKTWADGVAEAIEFFRAPSRARQIRELVVSGSGL